MVSQISDEQKVIALLKTIKEINAPQDIVTNFYQYSWHGLFAEIKKLDIEGEFIHFYGADDVKARLFSIRKPPLEVCPKPDSSLEPWLNPGWDMFDQNLVVKDILAGKNFKDSAARLQALAKWQPKREQWVARQKHLQPLDDLFARLSNFDQEFRKDPEQNEFVFAFGLFSDSKAPGVQHPLFTKRVKLNFIDYKNNIITITDSDEDLQFESMFLNAIENTDFKNYDKILELLNDGVDIFNPKDMEAFLSTVIHSLCGNGEFFQDQEYNYGRTRFQVKSCPMFILRKKTSGLYGFIDKLLGAINQGQPIPRHIIDLLGEGFSGPIAPPVVDDGPGVPIEKKLAALSGEDAYIYMTKPANKEQLRIAKQIENSDAVEVQGPPGTGKTHTIANLIGHFLAQGKTILVTSEKIKALSVLRDKLEEEIRPLCVPVFENRQQELEHSVHNILSKQSTVSTGTLQESIREAKEERQKLIASLDRERKAIFTIRNRQSREIIYNMQSYSLIDAAKLISDHQDLLPYIPGPVQDFDGLPLPLEQFQDFYASNGQLTVQEEEELALTLPDYNNFITPADFQHLVATIKKYDAQKESLGATYLADYDLDIIRYGKKVLFKQPQPEKVAKLATQLKSMPVLDKWQETVIADKLAGGGYAEKWNKLTDAINRYYEHDLQLAGEIVGKTITCADNADEAKLKAALPSLVAYLEKHTSVGKVYRVLHRDIKYVLETVQINGNEIATSADAGLVLSKFRSDELLDEVISLWEALLPGELVKPLTEIEDKQALYAHGIAQKIKQAIRWDYEWQQPLLKLCAEAGFNTAFFGKLDGFQNAVAKRVNFLNVDLVKHVEIAELYFAKKQLKQVVKKATAALQKPAYLSSGLCRNLINSLQAYNATAYTDAYQAYVAVYDKLPIYKKRQYFCEALSAYASDWTADLQNRTGLQNVTKLPCDLALAWQVKYFDKLLAELNSQSLEERQKKIIEAEQALRHNTCQLAGDMASLHLLQRMETHPVMTKALSSWVSLMKKVGRGYSKYAASYRKQAQRCMLDGQDAIPAWVVPVKKALEIFDPVRNHFDIIIVDEASQSSLEALVLTFMAKKIIVVGDDKQVSPMQVGMDISVIENILKKNLAPFTKNYSLFDGKTSFYEIVGTLYKAIMLKEHFRCVPAIIGYSNEKFYNCEILPLRDANTCNIQPPLVSCRVAGMRKRNSRLKVNEVEAYTIVALLKACLEQKEYDGKTFGVISLLGDEQGEVVNEIIRRKIGDFGLIHEREIICGNAASFQGDERDVIFLTMVDDDSTVRNVMRDDIAKRYNVAASRAKDQLWVVHSFDYQKLRAEDLRHGLLEYAEHFQSHLDAMYAVSSLADSPFEVEVAKRFLAKGYHIQQQYRVGAFYIDIVVKYKNLMIAVECDGAKYHSGELKIREDMERQSILERMGWRFIRIGGGQYYRDKDRTMDDVFRQLKEYGIYPESNVQAADVLPGGALLDRVKNRAAQILESWRQEDRKVAPRNVPEEVLDTDFKPIL